MLMVSLFLFRIFKHILLFLLVLQHYSIVNGKDKPNSPKMIPMKNNSDFSGFYLPNLGTGAAEWYAGAWLVSSERFLKSQHRLEDIDFLEGTTYAIVAYKEILMTRDYFDFQVIHLSSTTNQLPDETALDFCAMLLKRMKRVVKTLKTEVLEAKKKQLHQNPKPSSSIFGFFSSNPQQHQFSDDESFLSDPRVSQQTIAVIPYCSIPASVTIESYYPNAEAMKVFQAAIRILYFQATFWSVYRYFPHVLVSTASHFDLQTLSGLDLPIWRVLDLSPRFDLKAKLKEPGSVRFLPRESLLYLAARMRGEGSERDTEKRREREGELEGGEGEGGGSSFNWSQFKFVYFTEGDHLAQLRSLPHLYSALSLHSSSIALVPHRMQTLPLPKAFPRYQSHWPVQRRESLSHVTLFTEGSLQARGSCCDSGRFVFPPCGNWWYNCPYWGLSNYSEWVRFGREGYPMPLGSEHQARCSYSPHRVYCPLPSYSFSSSSFPSYFPDTHCISRPNEEERRKEESEKEEAERAGRLEQWEGRRRGRGYAHLGDICGEIEDIEGVRLAPSSSPTRLSP